MKESTNSSASLTIDNIRNFEGKYPKQLWYLFAVEMWERFCFYGMRGILVIFMVDQFTSMTRVDANLKYGAIQAFVYAFTFIGGIFADKILGFKKSLTFGAIMMIAGNGLIAASPHNYFFLGIALTIIGTGFFKPNVSSMVGELYNEKDSRRDAGFSMFYAGINLGAFLGGILCVWLGKSEDYGWSYAFGAAAVVMVLGLMTFLITKKYLGPIGESPLKNMTPSKRRMCEIAVYIGALLSIPLIFLMIENTKYTDIFMYTIGPLVLIYFFYILLYKVESTAAKKKLIAAFILTLFSIVFFALFEQAGGSLALFAKDNVKHQLLFFTVDPNIVNNAANSLYVIAFGPLIGLAWLALDKKGFNPNTVIKFAIGFVLLAGAYYIFYSCKFFADSEGMTSLNIFALAYLVITLAELCISPIGLSMITKLSPHNLAGMMMGLWFLASAYGQYLAGLIGASISLPDKDATKVALLESYTNGYLQLAIYALITAVVLFAVSKLIRKLMQEVK